MRTPNDAAFVASQRLHGDGVFVPMELAHLRYRNGHTYKDLVVADVVTALRQALLADQVVLGGGNAKKLGKLPQWTRLGDSRHAFIGGFRL